MRKWSKKPRQWDLRLIVLRIFGRRNLVQQDTAKMQGDRELPKVRSFPFGAHRTDIHHVEKLIIDKYLGIPYRTSNFPVNVNSTLFWSAT